MPRDGFVSAKEANGKQQAREVFRQEINALLTDDRAFLICQRFAYFYPLVSKTEIWEWIADNIGDEHVPFPPKPEEAKHVVASRPQS